MADVELVIAGRRYRLACRDGDEERLQELARIVDGKAAEAAGGFGGLGETRHLLMTALLLADELSDVRALAAATAEPDDSSAIDAGLALALEGLADRMEKLARRLEGEAPSP